MMDSSYSPSEKSKQPQLVLKIGAECNNPARSDLCGGAGGNLGPYRDRPNIMRTVCLAAIFGTPPAARV